MTDFPKRTVTIDGLGEVEVEAQGAYVRVTSVGGLDGPGVRINNVDYVLRTALELRANLKPWNGDERSSAEWDPRRTYNRETDTYDYVDVGRQWAFTFQSRAYALKRVGFGGDYGTTKANEKLDAALTKWADEWLDGPEGVLFVAEGELARAKDDEQRAGAALAEANKAVDEARSVLFEKQRATGDAKVRLENLTKGDEDPSNGTPVEVGWPA